MKKIYVSVICVTVIVAIIFTTPERASTSATQPVAGRTGAPSEGTCATGGCHGSSSGGSGNIALTFGGGNAYSPGVTYTMTVIVTDTSAAKFGFELTALDQTESSVGELTVLNPTNTVKPTIGAVSGREYISHKTANGNNMWTFEWTAPSSSVGDVTFYYAGNGANGNNSTSGDHIYLNTTTISVNAAIAVTNNSQAIFFVQNPASNELHMTYSLNQSSDVVAELFDVRGKKVMNILNEYSQAGNHVSTKSLDNISSGLYFIRFIANNKVQTSKVNVL